MIDVATQGPLASFQSNILASGKDSHQIPLGTARLDHFNPFEMEVWTLECIQSSRPTAGDM